jgi:hypothetical protein
VLRYVTYVELKRCRYQSFHVSTCKPSTFDAKKGNVPEGRAGDLASRLSIGPSSAWPLAKSMSAQRLLSRQA